MCTRTHTRAHTAFKAKGLISDAPVGEDGAEEWAGPAGVGGAWRGDARENQEESVSGRRAITASRAAETPRA